MTTHASSIAGALCLLGTLALASPGVRVAHAEEAMSVERAEPAMSVAFPSFVGIAEPAGSCSVDEARPSSRGSTAELVSQLRKRVIQLGDPGTGERVVTLNGRGANYRRQHDPMADLALLQVEAERAEAEGR